MTSRMRARYPSAAGPPGLASWAMTAGAGAVPVVDYAVVGAGSAGCVLAYRLAQAGRSVLVLEAGGDDRGIDEVRIPAAFSNLFKTRHDWDYETVEQKQMLGRRMYWPRGKLLGGSSSMNAQLYVRGN